MTQKESELKPSYNSVKTELDLISRQAAIDALTGWETEPLDEDIEHTLNNLPSVSTEKTGWWHKKYDSIVNDYFWECDTCKCGFQRDYPYCPNCGAKMEEEE